METDKGAVYIHYLNSDGSLKEDTVKIGHGTTNGPDIHDYGGYGGSIENIGDLDGDGVNDLAVGETNQSNWASPGYVHIHFMNADQSIKSTNEIEGDSPQQICPVIVQQDIIPTLVHQLQTSVIKTAME